MTAFVPLNFERIYTLTFEPHGYTREQALRILEEHSRVVRRARQAN